MNGMFEIMTLEETIDLMFSLQQKNPKSRDFPIGLYIETKMYNFYLDNFGINSADLLFQAL